MQPGIITAHPYATTLLAATIMALWHLQYYQQTQLALKAAQNYLLITTTPAASTPQQGGPAPANMIGWNSSPTQYRDPAPGMMMGVGRFGQYILSSADAVARNCQNDNAAENRKFLVDIGRADPSLITMFPHNPEVLLVFQCHHYFRSIITCTIALSRKSKVDVTVLSDDGACLNFGSKEFFSSNGMKPI